MIKILLVEDDEFKAADALKVLDDVVPDHEARRAASVSAALKTISQEDFDCIVLDMSLPTFDLSGPGGGGSPQGQGGLEVLRLARHLLIKSDFIILTQYPDIDIDGREVPLKMASKSLRLKFELNVIDCILYEFDWEAWKVPFREAVEDVRVRRLRRE